MDIPADQAEARRFVHPECLELGVATLPTHAVRVTSRTAEWADRHELHAVNEWLAGRLDGATWTRWRLAWPPSTDVFVTTDRQAAGVLAAVEQHGTAAALRLIELIELGELMANPGPPDEP